MLILLIKNEDILQILGKNLKQARKDLKYTQEFVSEGVNISIDLLRNIENGRNVGSVPTLLNLCNFLKISPNKLFEGAGPPGPAHSDKAGMYGARNTTDRRGIRRLSAGEVRRCAWVCSYPSINFFYRTRNAGRNQHFCATKSPIKLIFMVY